MKPPAFDPFPHGCPVGLHATPAEMPDLVSAICLKLRDVLRASIYIVNPSKGRSYPVVFLHVDQDPTPRLVLFPEWEDDARTRPVDFARQTTLLGRISQAGVPGETFDSARGLPSSRVGPGPLLCPLAVDAADVDGVLHDLYDRLGAWLRITVTRARLGGAVVPIVRIYVLDDEPQPRLVLYPSRVNRERISDEQREELLVALFDRRVPELPIEALFTT